MNDRLRLFSANLWAGAADPAALARQLQELEVDVCAVQELAPEQARAIASVLPHGKLEPDPDHHGGGIALRYPGVVRNLNLPLRDGRVVELEPEGWPQLDHPVEVMNLHIQAPHAFPFWRALATRRGQLERVLAYLDGRPQASRVVVGDFNATPLWPVYRHLAQRLRDAGLLHASAQGSRPRATWGPSPRSPRLLRIDHAFVAGLQVEHFEVLTVAGSDHSGLLVELAPDPAPTHTGTGRDRPPQR